jgi:hypothetical protein
MKRAAMLLAVGVLVLGTALSAMAQPTVSFGGQMRVFGVVSNNVGDFRDSAAGANRDSNSFYFQRFRLFTTVESQDKKARIVWAAEVGDITWGNGGGASGGNYGCTGGAQTVPATVPGAVPGTTVPVTYGAAGAGTRTGPSSGGCFGADGVNVETKHLHLWMDTGAWVPGSNILLGIHNTVFLASPIGAFMDDDGAGIQLNFKWNPVDLQLYTVKIAENAIANADDVNMFVARLGVNVMKGTRVTLEGMVVDQQNLAGQSFGDSFWIGGTVSTKVGTIDLHASAVYGQRALARAAGVAAGDPFEESGFGIFGSASIPVGSVRIFVIGLYTTGDDVRTPAQQGGTLTQDSDKLPYPDAGAGWFGGGGPWIAETLFGNSTIGAPGFNQAQYADPTGNYVFGASATWALTQALSIGGGVAYVGTSDAASPLYGDWAFTIDGGVIYRFNPNLTITGVGGLIFPDVGDTAWQLAFRTQFSF